MVDSCTAQPPPKTFVVGVSGYLGHHLFEALKAYHPDTLGTTRSDGNGSILLDFASPDIRHLKLRNSGYRYAILAAAVTSIARCERDPVSTRACNVAGTLELARQLVAEGIKPILFSSDYVFDGQTGNYSDDAPTRPLNEYGAQKAELEKRIAVTCEDNYLLLRLGKVFGTTKGDGTLLDEMASRLASRVEVRAAYDQVFCPVHIEDIIRVVFALQEKNAAGLFNVCGSEVWRRVDLAIAVAKAMGADLSLIKRISLDDLGEDFSRPKQTHMRCGRIGRLLGMDFVSVSSCISHIALNYTG